MKFKNVILALIFSIFSFSTYSQTQPLTTAACVASSITVTNLNV